MPPSDNVPVKIGKFKASKMIVQQSWAVLQKDKEIMWFPVLSAIASLIALVIMGAIFYFAVITTSGIHGFEGNSNNGIGPVGYLILFVYYLVMIFITNFFLAGIYTIAHGRFNGSDLSFSDGMNGAMKNLGKIFVWSTVSATVGVILKIISDKSGWIGKLVSGLLGAAWNILTYFSLPSLVIGGTSVKESFKESASIIRKNWGETIIINFGVGLFFGLISFLALALVIGIAILIPVTSVIVILAILFVLFAIAITIISSSLGAIFKLALYEYAKNGVVPQGFSPELVHGAVQAKKS